MDSSTGYTYRKDKRRQGYTTMRCTVGGCLGRANMTEGEGDLRITPVRHHTKAHLPDPSFKKQRDLREVLYSRARNEDILLSDIYAQYVDDPDRENIVRSMPMVKITPAMLWQRNKKGNHPPQPTSLQHFGELLQDPQYSRYACSTDGKAYFRRMVSGSPEEGTAVIFVSGELEHLMYSSDHFHIDGHFKTTPHVNGVYQVLTIMPEAYNHVFPVVTVLMSRKTKAAYKQMFSAVKQLLPGIRLKHVMTDFEKGLLAALREEFPASVLTGCLFHCDQAMCKKSAKLGLKPLLVSNEDAAKAVRMCMALPFLPAGLIRGGFNAIRQWVQQHANADAFAEPISPFLAYVETQWINGVGPDHISVYRHHKRTNNDQESYHRTLVNSFGPAAHPNPWKWIKYLKDHEAHHRIRYMQVSSAEPIARTRKRNYRLMDRRLTNLTRLVYQMPVIHFLSAASFLCKQAYQRVVVEGEEEEELDEPEIGPPPPPTEGDAVDEWDQEDEAADLEGIDALLEAAMTEGGDVNDGRAVVAVAPARGTARASAGAQTRGGGRRATRGAARGVPRGTAAGGARGTASGGARGAARGAGATQVVRDLTGDDPAHTMGENGGAGATARGSAATRGGAAARARAEIAGDGADPPGRRLREARFGATIYISSDDDGNHAVLQFLGFKLVQIFPVF
ncbi:hypothetical protein ONE63_011468 [Megalurothrips usitatus]|uniref:MULE transposase domain-containing protein n=1 Tax=Megalurothrips usitatus TaxID=439358 RepID=A0AAV7X370_9NEOP|nr:hypothetical protein ONE63_011468 [Megalurothrips usitatus]